MPAGPQPGDLKGLAYERLAASRDYVALAAILRSHANPPPDAVRALFGAAASEAAFIWSWASLKANDALWQHVDMLAGGLRVPASVQQEVHDFILAEVTQTPRGRPSPPTNAGRETLLRRLDPKSTFARSVSRSSLAADASTTQGVREAALDILGQSRRRRDRDLVLEGTASIPASQRPAALLRLQSPYSRVEAESLADAIAIAGREPPGQADWTAAAKLAARLPTDQLEALLAANWQRSDNRQQLLQAGLLSELGADRVKALLERKLGEEPTRQVLTAAAAHLGTFEQTLDFGVWAHQAYPAAWTKPLRDRQLENLTLPRRLRPEKHREAIRALLAFANATDEIEPTIALAQVALPDDLAIPQDPPIDRNTAFRLGQLMGALLLRGVSELERAADDAIASVPKKLRGHFYAGVANCVAVSETHDAVPMTPTLSQRLVSDGEAIRAFCKAGFASQVVDMVAGSREASLRVLLAASDNLNPDQVRVLLHVVDWTKGGSDDYRGVVDRLKGHPTVLFDEVPRVVNSLHGPEADSAPAEILCHVLDAALAAGLQGQLEPDVATTCLETLLAHPDSEVVARGCIWVDRLNAEESAIDPARVKAIVGADDARGGRHLRLHDVRLDLGARLAALAMDQTLPTDQRGDNLRLAVDVDPMAARGAAFEIANSTSNAIRDVAADVLVRTPAGPTDHERLLSLVSAEPQTSIRAKFDTALHQVESGSIGEALRNLAGLLGLPATNLDSAVLVPEASFHERFLLWIDKARARSDDAADPGPFVEAAINITDLMVDVAVVERHSIGNSFKLADGQANGIRTNSKPRPDTGTLLGRQDLQQVFEWFPACLTLRAKRMAHPAPLGGVVPLHLTPDDLIAARTLLRDITVGWVASMWETENLSHRPAQET